MATENPCGNIAWWVWLIIGLLVAMLIGMIIYLINLNRRDRQRVRRIEALQELYSTEPFKQL